MAASHHMADMELFNVEADMASFLNDLSNEDLDSFAELQDPTNDDQFELYVYTCFLVSKKSGSMGHLEQAIQQAERWVAVTPTDHSDRTRRSHIHEMMLAWGYQIRFASEDIVATNLGDDRRTDQEPVVNETGIQTRHLSSQAVRLAKSYEQIGHLEDLKEAIKIMEQVLELGGAYIEPDMLSNLGAMLGLQFIRIGSIDDLNRAVDVTSTAVDATSQDHPNRVTIFNNLGIWLDTRFRRTGSIDDLNRAVDITSIAVDATPQDHSDRASLLNNLGT
ncbi:hypothetical protein B0T26DRAFT_303312 [Lasiosphaeria miniovina]|uniref:Uncharacterized protein n=1 Tax=Lasiosphaeria miniovina TaxID=1954250 RepID=A0AA40AKZ2_9PEZI|nr:uncharacterized protein B0T26DRAFT_303312 [Lasiosphaeria miniovina]KAK0717749.1 hypothetical protein B0T26DRAFT_303312 [Lasiosphaeria miniovina]